MMGLGQTEFQLGDIVEGRYQILRKLATGGMGTVYLAEHVLIRRRVALKLLHAELAADSTMVRRFMNEAAAAGTLGHPHIVESTDMGFTRDGVPYIVFEYLEGCLLVEEVYRLGGLPVRRALQIASQIASALEAAHSAKIVHLDLKSDNVFLIARGGAVDHVKVLDFGISRFLETELDRADGAQLAGTPEFMSPEQVTMPDQVDGRADIYALGVLLYEMLTARCPHVNNDRRLLLHQVVHEAPAPLDRPVPPEVEHLLFDQLLVKSRDARIQTMCAVKETLDELSTLLRAASSDPALFAFEEPSEKCEIASSDRDDAAAVRDAARDAVPAINAAPPSAPVPVLAPATVRAPASGLRRPRSGWAVAALLAGVAGGALWIADRHHAREQDRALRAAIEGDAASLAARLGLEAHVARERAEVLASSPVVRAALETDSATLTRMIEAGQLFHPRSGEVLELVRTRGPRSVVLRLPRTAIPLGSRAGAPDRFTVEDSRLRVIASAPVRTQDGKVAGVLSIATPVDLSSIARLVREHAASATLLGLDRPLIVARRPVALVGESIEVPVSVPVAIDGDLGRDPRRDLGDLHLSLVAALEPAGHPETLSELRRANWALGAGLVLIYTFSWLVYGIRAIGHLRTPAAA